MLAPKPWCASRDGTHNRMGLLAEARTHNVPAPFVMLSAWRKPSGLLMTILPFATAGFPMIPPLYAARSGVS